MLHISLDVGRRFAGLDLWLSLHLVGSEIWLDWNWNGELCKLGFWLGWRFHFVGGWRFDVPFIGL